MGGRIYTCDGPGCDEADTSMPVLLGLDCFTDERQSYRFCCLHCLQAWLDSDPKNRWSDALVVRHYPT